MLDLNKRCRVYRLEAPNKAGLKLIGSKAMDIIRSYDGCGYYYDDWIVYSWPGVFEGLSTFPRLDVPLHRAVHITYDPESNRYCLGISHDYGTYMSDHVERIYSWDTECPLVLEDALIKGAWLHRRVQKALKGAHSAYDDRFLATY